MDTNPLAVLRTWWTQRTATVDKRRRLDRGGYEVLCPDGPGVYPLRVPFVDDRPHAPLDLDAVAVAGLYGGYPRGRRLWSTRRRAVYWVPRSSRQVRSCWSAEWRGRALLTNRREGLRLTGFVAVPRPGFGGLPLAG